jgi:hypothetical protein
MINKEPAFKRVLFQFGWAQREIARLVWCDLVMLQATSSIDRKVGQDTIATGSFETEKAFHHHSS